MVINAVSKSQAIFILGAVRSRMFDCGLELHPDKTKIVYCKDEKRKDECPTTSFDFLGFTLKQRSQMVSMECLCLFYQQSVIRILRK